MSRFLGGALLALVIIIALVGCQGGEPAEQVQEGAEMKLQVYSDAFAEGAAIPKKYTCDGQDLSPPLSWSELPAGTRSLALICDDPDAPIGTWVHWVAFNLPYTARSLPEGVPPAEQVAGGGMQGKNSWKRLGYGGPCPPRGSTHRYFFKLYALDSVLNLKAGATKQEVERASEGHILAQGQFMGRYSR